MLDLAFNYSPDEAYQIMTAYGESGRQYYVSVFSLIDLFTPILMNLFLSTVISAVFLQAFSPDNPVQKLNLLPFVAMAGDYLENLSIVALMLAYPTRLDVLARAASFFTAVKFAFTAASLACIVIGIVVWLVKRRVIE